MAEKRPSQKWAAPYIPRIGTIENAGSGQETEFFAAEDDSAYTQADFAAFAADCHRDGVPLGLESVMELLVEEFECAAIVRDVHGHAGTHARQTIDGKITGWAQVEQRPQTHDELAGLVLTTSMTLAGDKLLN